MSKPSMSKPFELSPLPYDEDALAPAISARTVEFHYHKHHKTYVETLNKVVAGTRYADMKLEQIVRTTAGRETEQEKKIFNNAGQVWNHDFYWRSLSPHASKPDGKLAQAIERDFGGLEGLLKQFAAAGTAAGTVIVICALAGGVPATPCAVSVTVYTLFDVVLEFAGTVIAPPPLQVAAEGSVSAAAPAGRETSLRLQLTVPGVAKATVTEPPLLLGSVVDWGVNELIVAEGPA